MQLRIAILALLFIPVAVHADSLSSTNYRMPATVLDSAGQTKSSSNYQMVDSIGQPSTVNVSTTSQQKLQAGFIPAGTASPTLSKATLNNIISALKGLLPGASKQTSNAIRQAIRFLNKALTDLAAYQGGNANSLVQTIIDARQTIQFMESIAGTAPYQKLLAMAVQQAAHTEVARLAASAPAGSSSITDAQQDLTYGDKQLLNGAYFQAVNYYKDAVQSALQA